jgi:hypothetical protein
MSWNAWNVMDQRVYISARVVGEMSMTELWP